MSSYSKVLKDQKDWSPGQPVPLEFQREFLRTAVEDQPDMFVAGRLPFGIWSHTAAPGCYKSAVAHQFETAIVDGTPIPGLDWVFAERGDVLVISPDESFGELQRRELSYTAFGLLDTDGDDFDKLNTIERATIHFRVPVGETFEQRIIWLYATIADIEAATGRKILWIRWDTGAHLIGDSERNAYDHIKPLQDLGVRMAAERRVLFLPWHENREGRTMGTTGIQAYSNCNTQTKMTAGETEGKIVTGKVRGAAAWSAAVSFSDGFAERITDLNPMVSGRTREGSVAQLILAFLSHGPATVGEIEAGTGAKNATVRMTLMRAKRAGEVKKVGNQWQLVDSGGTVPATGPVRWVEGDRVFGVCDVCNTRMLVYEDGQTTHPGCDTDAEPVAAAPALTLVPPPAAAEPEPEEEDTPEKVDAVRLLRESIESSKKHPVLRVPAAERDCLPWSLMTEPMRGEHRFRRAANPDNVVVVVDRNGSYPSAGSNVPVAANILHHTGPMESLAHDTTKSGIYLVSRVDWVEPGIGHPLGEIHDRATDSYWVTTPHLRLLTKLAEVGRIDPINILDSWTGVTATNLFTQFSADVQEARRRTAGNDEAYTRVKRTTSVAMRLLWPKGARSPFYRPDWSLSLRAEASVRHWVRADQAVQAGATLLKLGSVDEAAFIQPDNAPYSGWAPKPYKLGTAFGEVKVKNLLTGEEFNAER